MIRVLERSNSENRNGILMAGLSSEYMSILKVRVEKDNGIGESNTVRL